MRIIIWKSYGEIDVYAAETPEQVTKVFNAMIEVLKFWNFKDEVADLKKDYEKYKDDATKLTVLCVHIAEIHGQDSESFEYFRVTNLQE